MKFESIYLKILLRFVKENEKTIHVEAIVRDDLWEKLINLIGKNYVWFIMTPTNYDYCKSYFNIKVPKEEFKRKLVERIEYLKEKGEEIQLHIHLCNVKKFFDNELQEEKFSEAMEFMNSIGINPIKIAPGWNAYNNYTLKLAKEYGFKFFYLYSKNPLDINRPKMRDGLIIKYFYKFWHDYDFV